MTGNDHHGPWARRGVSVTIDPSAPLWRPVRYRGFRSARGFNSATCRQAATPIAARPGHRGSRWPSRTAATDGAAIQRIRGPGASGGRPRTDHPLSDVPPGSSHRQRPSRLTTDQERYFRHARLLSDGNFTRLGSSWPVVISPAEWLLLAGRLSRDSGAYSVTTWVTRRPDSGRLGKEIGSWLRPFRVGHVAQAAADRDWCAQECLMAARARVGG